MDDTMQVNISKTLEAIIARTAFKTTKQGQQHALKDQLATELLREEGSLAYQLLTTHLEAWQLYQLSIRLKHLLDEEHPTATEVDAEHFFRGFRNELCAKYSHLKRISTAHALREIIADPSTHTAGIMARYRITVETIDQALAEADGAITRQAEQQIRLLDYAFEEIDKHTSSTPQLDKLGTDLTAEARRGAIDPVIGREREIERVIQILARRKKNNPILIGEAGVGKTAIVEGLALRIVEGNVPHALRNKRLFALDIAALVAGTKFRGEFEERMQQLLDELKQNREVILFIDEIHTIVGAGSTQGSLDTANILKPALARGELQTIGATTLDEYRTDIERDAALERRFQRVMVEPTSAEETLQILQRIAPRYEAHHGVRYTEEALRASIALTDRYITDRHLPDKAIDLIDEAGSRAQAQAGYEPESLRARAKALAEVQQERRSALDAAHYDKAAAARMRELKLRAELEEARSTHRRAQSKHRITIDRAAIEQVITSMTGIPIERISGSEQQRLLGLQQHLASRVIGQQEAVASLSQAILRARTGLKEPHRPIGVFLFVGPTGVGKTLLAKELSKWLFDQQRGLIRIDMSEYSEKHNVARLIGSPPGYVGYSEGGQLTEAVRRRPYAVVLFDEIEKAHPELFNTLLQLFDEGHLTDGTGRKVDFRNTVLVMTSNVGSREMANRPRQIGFSPATRNKEEHIAPKGYERALERTFAPEFLNRIDRIVPFRALGQEDIEQIVSLEFARLAERVEALGYGLRITERARQRLASMGYLHRFGARALQRTLSEQVEVPLSQLLVEGRLRSGDVIVVESSRNEGIRLRVA